ncbi:MAG: lysophospholipid acyltransferase family protein [Patescibacteria group bacterium]|jgi:1-acyl-sn-glycerol-3-phosphate acyltransferase
MIAGQENIPKNQFILTSNHESPLDPILLMLALKKPVRFSAAGHLFRPWWKPKTWWYWLTLKLIGRTIPTGDKSMAKILQTLQKGKIVGIFPEGDVHPALKQNRIHTGAIILSQLAQIPILPVHITGSAKFWAFPAWKIQPWHIGKIQVKIGKSFLPAKVDLADKLALQTIADNLMKSILAL